MNAHVATPAPSIVVLPLSDVPAGVRPLRVFVRNQRNPAQWIKLPLDARADMIENVLTGKRATGWDPVVVAECSEQAVNAARASAPSTEPTPPAAPVSGAALLEEILTAPRILAPVQVIEADGVRPATPAETEAHRATLVVRIVPAVVDRSWAAESVDAEGAARSARDEATLASLGLAIPAAWFALGTTLVDVGVDNARRSREEFEALPEAVSALAALEAEVVAEARRDLPVGLADLTITPAGALARVDGPGRPGFELGLEPEAAKRLQADLRAALKAPGDLGVVTGLASPDQPVVAQAAGLWNAYAGALATREARAGERKQIVLRTREVEQRGGARRRQVYAAVSERYGECDTGKIAAATRELAAGVGGDVRAEVLYDRRGVSIDLLTHTTVQPDRQVVGDIFRAGLRLRSDDTGGGSLRVSSVAFRVRCRNYTVVSAEGSITVIRHLGSAERLLERLREALAASSGVLRTFAAQWSTACGRETGLAMVRQLETDRAHRTDLRRLVDHLLEGRAHQQEQDDLLDGIYRDLLARNELARKADLEEQVTLLRAAHYSPVNQGGAAAVSPAAVANGLTLWAQGRGRHDSDAAELVAGRVISGDEVLGWLAAPK